MNFAVVAKSPIKRIHEWAKIREWNNLYLLSSEKNTYNVDYFAEAENGDQMPMVNIFVKNESGVFHTYASELLYAPSDEGQDPRPKTQDPRPKTQDPRPKTQDPRPKTQDPRPKTQDMSILFGHYGTCLILFQ
jgi:predicted dithiol-disulfide oxidoreductase (DUF899 family)